MRLRNAVKPTPRRLGAVVTVILAAGGAILLASSSASPSAFQECMRGFTEGEAAGAPQWLKEKSEGQAEECHRREHLRERSPQEMREAKEKFALAHPRPAPSATPESTNRFAGITESHESPPGMSTTFYVSNRWSGTVNGEWYVVAAGATKRFAGGNYESVRSGVAVFRDEPSATSRTDSLTYVATESPAGEEQDPLTIVGENGDTLDLKSRTGAELSFNIATLTFGQRRGS